MSPTSAWNMCWQFRPSSSPHQASPRPDLHPRAAAMRQEAAELLLQAHLPRLVHQLDLRHQHVLVDLMVQQAHEVQVRTRHHTQEDPAAHELLEYRAHPEDQQSLEGLADLFASRAPELRLGPPYQEGMDRR